MTDTSRVLAEDRGRVRVLTLNRPAQLNAFDDAMYDAFTAELIRARHDADCAVLIVTGQGRAFTAGQDLGELESRPEHADNAPHGFEPFMNALQSFPKPLIAAVNGIGVGIGLTMLLHCDFVLMAKSARLRAPFVSLGVTAEAGSSVLLPARVGWSNAAHILYSAAWLSADDAVACGLAREAVDDDTLMDAAFALAEPIAAMPISSLTATKGLLLAGRNDAVDRARERERTVFEGLRGGPANREAIAAFKEKRAADFTNIG